MSRLSPSDVPCKRASEVRLFYVSFVNLLNDGAELSGSVTVAEDGTSGLTFSNAALISSALKIDGVYTPANKGVVFKVTGGTAGTTYKIKITVNDNSTPAETLIDMAQMSVIADNDTTT